MHPIEYLRYVARAGDAPAEWLVPEAAEALRGLIGDHNALVMGCRKLLEHHPHRGPMWWLCGHVLAARDPHGVLDELIVEFERDPTPLQLSLALADVPPGAGGSPLIVETTLASAAGVLVGDQLPGSTTAAGSGGGGPQLWVVAGVGTVVPVEIFSAVTCGMTGGVDRGTTGPAVGATGGTGPFRGAGRPLHVAGADAIDRVIRPTGAFGAEVLRHGTDVPFIPELLARG